MKRTAIVTGGSRGIGLAIAKQLGLDGYQVVVFATKPLEDCMEFSFYSGPGGIRTARHCRRQGNQQPGGLLIRARVPASRNV